MDSYLDINKSELISSIKEETLDDLLDDQDDDFNYNTGKKKKKGDRIPEIAGARKSSLKSIGSFSNGYSRLRQVTHKGDEIEIEVISGTAPH